jgi:sec-independent protein translocase protein TatA
VNVFGIGLPEMVLIFVLALLIFGPKKLPEIGRSVGKAIRSFQDASKEFQDEFKREAEQIEQAISKPMEASLEQPSQPVLPPTETEAVDRTDDAAPETAEKPSEEVVSPS